MTTEQIVRFMGKTYKVVPDTPVVSSCMACAFEGDQRHMCNYETWDKPESTAPTQNCVDGQHYYVEVVT